MQPNDHDVRMRVTVVLCTYNRCQTLGTALDSLVVSVLPESIEWEILVVDNNSGDQTRDVVLKFAARFPGRFRYLFEPRPGKSHALNAAIQAANGDVLAFVDDDVTVEPDWLPNLTLGLRDHTWAGAGGRIFPKCASRPPWLSLKTPHTLAPLVGFDLGGQAGELKEPPFGTNMAFRKEMFARYGTFRTDLGPRPGSEIRDEDTEFGARLLAAGERLRYEPSAIVHHPAPAHRTKKQYFLSWWYDKGRAGMRQRGPEPGTRFYTRGIPLYLFRRAVTAAMRWWLTLQPANRFSRKTELWEVLGEIAECAQQSRTPKNGTLQRFSPAGTTRGPQFNSRFQRRSSRHDPGVAE